MEIETIECAKLEYQDLGEGTNGFGGGNAIHSKRGDYFPRRKTAVPATMSLMLEIPDTCVLAVSANRSTTLTSNQISTAFNTPGKPCGGRSLFDARSGLSRFSPNPQELSGRKKQNGRSDEQVTGLNMLPKGARVDS